MREAVLDLRWIISISRWVGLGASCAISVLVFVCQIKFVSIFIDFAGDASVHAWRLPSEVVVVIGFASVYHLVQLSALLSTESEADGNCAVSVLWVTSSRILVVSWWYIFLVNFVGMMRFCGSRDLIWCIRSFLSNRIRGRLQHFVNSLVQLNMVLIDRQCLAVVNLVQGSVVVEMRASFQCSQVVF